LGQLERDQVKNLMRESRFYVVSSHVETFGVVVIEALSQGVPVISTKCGGPESILTSEDGYLVDVNNVNALVEGMENILANSEKFNQKN
jgi:glycosyltransferase involved in cell wall biosynthesis